MKIMMKVIFLMVISVGALWADSFAPAAGEPGSMAVALDDARVQRWATAVAQYSPGEDVDERWQVPENALGEAEGNAFDIVGLGRGGEITLEFSPVIQDGKGADFAVFENGFSDTFLELAFVEVSSDGVNFFRFENVSETDRAVGAFGSVNPRKVDGLAGKYRLGFGTPFDLQDLEGTVGLDVSAVKYVRLIDVVGGTSLDSTGGVIYDPWPGSGAAGFDLDAVAVLGVVETRVLSTEIVNQACVIHWESVPGEVYVVERNTCLGEEGWALVEEVEALLAMTEITQPLAGADRSFFRVRLR